MSALSMKWRLFVWIGERLTRPTESMPLEQARKAFRKACAGPTFTMGVRAPLASVRDEQVAGVKVRRYLPHDAKPGMLIYFHGGGWVVGDVHTHDTPASALAAATQREVVSVDYRLAPEHRYPAALEDCLKVTKALAASAPVVVAGDSAGGNLAAVVANRCAAEGVALRGQVLVYPITDCAQEHPSYEEFATGFILTRHTMRFYIAQYLPDAGQRVEPDCSPLRAASVRGVAPAMVLLSSCDPLRDEGRAYAEKLRGDGVEVEVVEERLPHGYLNFQGLPEGKATAQRIAAWLSARW